MMKTRRITLALFVLLIATMGIQYTARSSDNSYQPQGTPPKIVVRILELSGTGPNGNSHQLYVSKNGYTTSLATLGRIGSQVDGQGLKEGAYHTLYVRLHDRYQRIGPDGNKISGSFTEQGKPTYLRVRGMIMVKSGVATPLRMLDHTHEYNKQQGKIQWDDD